MLLVKSILQAKKQKSRSGVDLERLFFKPVKCFVAIEMVLETIILKLFKSWTSCLHNTSTE